MIEIIAAPDHVAAFRLSGTLTEEDVEQVITDVEARLARHEKIGLVADLTGFHDISIRAGLRDLRYSFGKMLEWRRFPREAVITDRQWVRTLVSLTSPLIPFVTLRTFAAAERDAALVWAADIGAVPPPT